MGEAEGTLGFTLSRCITPLHTHLHQLLEQSPCSILFSWATAAGTHGETVSPGTRSAPGATLPWSSPRSPGTLTDWESSKMTMVTMPKQVFPLTGGDADRELQRASSLLLPATHLPAAAAAYFAICFYLLMLVMVEGYGGKEALLSTLKDVPMVVSTGPCCCCCPCLPRMTMSKRKLQLMMLGTFQYAFFRVVAVFVGLVLAADGNYNPADISAESVALWINTVVGASTLFGLWALAILFRQARLHLAEQNIKAKFACFQILLILTALQPAIFSILANSGSIACSPPFSSKARSQQMNVQMLIPQTFILAVVTRMYYRKQDDKPGYQPFSYSLAGTDAKA